MSYPIYNSDHNHATPSFILQEDKVNFWYYKVSFQIARPKTETITWYENVKLPGLKGFFGKFIDFKSFRTFPNQNLKQTTVTFVDNLIKITWLYFFIITEHIQSQSHHEKIRNNIYTKYIDDLAHRF